MRKRDFLRKYYNKAIKRNNKSIIYYIELPEEFKKKKDYEMPCCSPITNENGKLVGISVEHPYEYNGDIFTDSECFYFL